MPILVRMTVFSMKNIDILLPDRRTG